jgi:type I restriction enzyme S subunit
LQKSLENNAPESAQKNINLAILRDLDVPVPPISLQEDFAGRVAAVEKLKTAFRNSLAKLDELFAALQYRAFRGEL